MDISFEYSIDIWKEAVIFSGIFLNSLIIIIQSRRTFRGTWLNVYLQILAINSLINNILFALDSIYSPFPLSFLTLNIPCKLSQYFIYAFCASASWILAFISIDRYISISFYRKPKIFETKIFNFAIFAMIFSWHFTYYSPYIIYFQSYNNFNESSYEVNLTVLNIAENQTSCLVIDSDIQTVLGYMDSINSTLLPFIVMLIFSILIIIKIRTTKNKISHQINLHSKSKVKRQRKDLKFSIIILMLNAVYLLFGLPISIDELYTFVDNEVLITFAETYYTIDFFVYLITNSSFRDEFLILLHIKNRKMYIKSSSSNRITVLPISKL